MRSYVENIISHKTLVLVALLVMVLGLLVVSSDVTFAVANSDEVTSGINEVGGKESGNQAADFTGILTNIINLLLFLVGTISVIMIIIGGIRYATSNGEQAQITSAKNTVLYSVVGVVVALISFALVNFIVGKI